MSLTQLLIKSAVFIRLLVDIKSLKAIGACLTTKPIAVTKIPKMIKARIQGKNITIEAD